MQTPTASIPWDYGDTGSYLSEITSRLGISRHMEI